MSSYMSSLANIRTPQKESYFLTQTLKPAFYSLNARRQLVETKSRFRNILKRYGVEWSFVVELTKSANVHYHAHILLKRDDTITRLCIIDDLKVFGNSKLEKIKHPEEIKKYMLKDIEITDKLLNYTRLGRLKNQKLKIVYESEDGSDKQKAAASFWRSQNAPLPFALASPSIGASSSATIDFDELDIIKIYEDSVNLNSNA